MNPPVRICASTGAGRRAIHRCPGRPSRGPKLRHCPCWRVTYGGAVVHRYYDPATEQFLSVDPAVVVTAQPYSFTRDDPVNETDALGLGLWSDITSFVADHASTIAFAAGVASFIPGVDLIATPISVGAGALATYEDASHGRYLSAALDALGSAGGVASAGLRVYSSLLKSAADSAWDASYLQRWGEADAATWASRARWLSVGSFGFSSLPQISSWLFNSTPAWAVTLCG